MNWKSILSVGLFTCLFISCQNVAKQHQNNTEESKDATKELITKDKGQTFGEAITATGAINYKELLSKMQGQDSLAIKVKGTVDEVCQAKGCWMNIVEKDSESEPMMVKFKDYGFFVPKDIAGRKVIMEGYAYRNFTSVEELRHYAEDAGKSKEEIAAITEPVEELKFLASGVLLLDE